MKFNEGQMKYFKVYTLGCKINQVDSRNLNKFLCANGWREAIINQPDWIFVNSCSVTMGAINKTKKLIMQLKKEYIGAKIALIGCYAKVYLGNKKINLHKQNKKIKLGADNILLSLEDIKKFVFICGKKGEGNKKKATEEINDNGFKIDSPFAGGRARYYLKIQEGCNQFCTYCVIPYARTHMVSKAKKEIIQEAKAAIKAGYREIILCGIHLGRFSLKGGGRGIGDGRDLAKLVGEIIKLKNLGRVRLSSIEITEVTDELIDLMKQSEKICPHLHISLQSGSDRILRLMHRPYTKKFFLDRIEKIKKLLPKIALTTDVIVGFPGEEEQDFQETVNLIRKIGMARVHVFSFSAHERTIASKLPNQVKPSLRKQRASRLRIINEELERKYLAKMRGTLAKIVVEKTVNQNAIGRSEYYYPLIAKVDGQVRRGQLVDAVF